MKSKSVFLTVPLVAFACTAVAQEQTVMRENDITESTLIDALTPVPPQKTSRLRSIRVNPNDDSARTYVKPAKPASASLLITFETDSAALTPRSKQLLDIVAQALDSNKLADFRFAIQGHADPRGDSESNLRLSQMRAESVRQYLVQYKGVQEARLEAVGKGDKELLNVSNPIAPENRRVTIVNLTQ